MDKIEQKIEIKCSSCANYMEAKILNIKKDKTVIYRRCSKWPELVDIATKEKPDFEFDVIRCNQHTGKS